MENTTIVPSQKRWHETHAQKIIALFFWVILLSSSCPKNNRLILLGNFVEQLSMVRLQLSIIPTASFATVIGISY
ncbi:MAG: hypothetical protein HZB17_06230 [Chloroflexi bacterium]|nr:hypothetical protein [Chloroflexota bacterium]